MTLSRTAIAVSLTLSLAPAVTLADSHGVKPPAPYPTKPTTAPEPTLPNAPTRPIVSSEVDIDYASVPLEVDAPVIHSSGEASFSVQTLQPEYAEMAPPTWVLLSRASDAVFIVGNRLLTNHSRSSYPDSSGRPAGAAEWFVLHRAHSGDDHLELLHFASKTPSGATETVAATSSKAIAAAVVPGELYAFRQCTAGCDEDLASPNRRERLIAVGPPALWRGSSTRAPMPVDADDRPPFSVVAADIAPGRSASVELDVSRAQENALRWRAPLRDGPAKSFTLDVVWEEGDSPRLMLFEGTIDAADGEISEERGYRRYGARTVPARRKNRRVPTKKGSDL